MWSRLKIFSEVFAISEIHCCNAAQSYYSRLHPGFPWESCSKKSFKCRLPLRYWHSHDVPPSPDTPTWPYRPGQCQGQYRCHRAELRVDQGHRGVLEGSWFKSKGADGGVSTKNGMSFPHLAEFCFFLEIKSWTEQAKVILMYITLKTKKLLMSKLFFITTNFEDFLNPWNQQEVCHSNEYSSADRH